MGLFRLRLAYGRLDWQNFAIEIGQDWSIFAPLNPASIAMYAVAEFNGRGNPWGRVPQLRIEAKDTLSAKNRLLYQRAFSDPDDGDFVATFTGSRPPGAGELGHVPAVESRLAWSSSGKNGDYMFGCSGRYGPGKKHRHLRQRYGDPACGFLGHGRRLYAPVFEALQLDR
jgi:hypothetical protein